MPTQKTSATLHGSAPRKDKTSATLHGTAPRKDKTSATLHGNAFLFSVSRQPAQIVRPKNVQNHYFRKLLEVFVMPSKIGRLRGDTEHFECPTGADQPKGNPRRRQKMKKGTRRILENKAPERQQGKRQLQEMERAATDYRKTKRESTKDATRKKR